MPVMGLEVKLVLWLEKWSEGTYRLLESIDRYRQIYEKVLVDIT